jgi:hypothetical protein
VRLIHISVSLEVLVTLLKSMWWVTMGQIRAIIMPNWECNTPGGQRQAKENNANHTLVVAQARRHNCRPFLCAASRVIATAMDSAAASIMGNV